MNAKRLRIVIAAAALAAAAFSPAWATGVREVPSGTSPDAYRSLLPLDAELSLGRLSNGLTYYIRENSEPSDRAFLRLVVNVGSIVETEDERGLAHFLEHMAFNGTEDFPGNEIVTFLESLGMGFGPDINAYTTFDETVYMLEIPTDEEGKLRSGVHVLEQWARGMTLTQEEIESERGVILEERRQRQGARSRMREEQYPVLFHDSRYAERLPIGKQEVIEEAGREDFLRFYNSWYRPELMAVVAVGDFDRNRVQRLIKEYFAPLEKRDDAPRRDSYPVPDHEETLYALAADPEAQSTNVSIYNKREPSRLNTVGDYRDLLVHRLFGSMINTRFSEVTSDPDAPLLSAGAYRTRLVRTKGVNVLGARVMNEEIVAGMQRLVAEGRRVREFGFTESELERAKSSVTSSYERSYQERNTTNSKRFVSEYTRHYLENEAAPGIEREYDLVQSLLPTITLSEVNGQAADYLKRRNRVVLVSAVQEEGFSLPNEARLATALREAEAAELERYAEETTSGPLLANPPQPGSIRAERGVEQIDAVEWQLSNGARVIAKQTDFKSDQIVMSAFARGGTSTVARERYLSASFSADLVRESGVAQLSKTQLEKLLSDKNVELAPFVSELQIGFSGSSSTGDLETLMKLTHLYATEPRRDEQAFRRWKQRTAAILQNRSRQPQRQFIERVEQILAQDHPRRRPMTSERLEEVKLDEAMQFYSSSFSDVSDFTFVFVGNFEESRLRTLAEQYLASLPAEPDRERFADIGISRPDGAVTETVRSGIAPQSIVGIVYHGSYEWSPENNHRLRSLAGLLQLELREVLREEQSATYGISTWAELSHYPQQRYRLNIYFGTDPARAEELSELARELIEELRSAPPGASAVQRVKAGQRSSFETSRENNEFWLQTIEDIYWNDISPGVVEEYPARIEQIDAAELHQTAQRFLNPESFVQVILFPESES